MSEPEFDWDAVIDELRKPNGWIKGDYGPFHAPDGGVCLRGACFRILGGYDRLTIAGALDPIVRAHFAERVGDDPDPVPKFNDHPDTTLDDVILVAEKARAASGELS